MIKDLLVGFQRPLCDEDLLAPPVLRGWFAAQIALRLQPLQQPRYRGMGKAEMPFNVPRIDRLLPAGPVAQIAEHKGLRAGQVQGRDAVVHVLCQQLGNDFDLESQIISADR